MAFRNLGPFVSIVREGWDKTLLFAKFFCCLHVTSTYLVTPVETYGPSMLPTMDLIPNWYLSERISSRFGKVSRGDIIVLQSSRDPRRLITKRLVGMEGDSVTYSSSPNDSDKRETVVVPKGYVWVQGDNQYSSKDSRNFGPVPYGLIHSRLFWRVYPLNDFGPYWKH